MNTKALVKRYGELRLTDPAAAEALRQQHQDNELFHSLIKFSDALRPAIIEGQAKPQPPVQEHPLFPAVELQQPRTACGDSREE